MNWKRAWAVKLKRMDCGIFLWSNLNWRKPEAFSNLASWCASTVLAVVFFFNICDESRSSVVRQLRSLNHRKFVESLLIWLVAHKNHLYLFLPCRIAIIILVRPPSHLSQLFRRGQRWSWGQSKTKILQEKCVSDGFTPVTVYFCFSCAGSTEFLCCL